MSKHRHSQIISIAVAFLATALFASCFPDTVFYQYHSTSLKGWDRVDKLEFSVPVVNNSGYYLEEIGVRTDGRYPFRTLSLVVDQTVVATAGHRIVPQRSDTLGLEIYDDSGKPLGDGVSIKQHVMPFRNIQLETGDSIFVSIHHNMRRASLEGVAGIGLKVTEY